jgi:spermidine synthase
MTAPENTPEKAPTNGPMPAPMAVPKDIDLWVEERHRDIMAMRYRVKKTLFSARSPFQKIDIVETEGHGRMLLNDGLVMISERDEHIYHEMIAHVPLFVHPEPRRVLVIGGGDGGTVREVLRHEGVEVCVLVEIDAMVIEACKAFIPQTAAALDDPRARVLVADGVEYVAATDEPFDVVIVDSTDPIGPAAPLFDAKFYANVKKLLKENGIVISQAESPFYEMETQNALLSILKGLFERVHVYNFSNLTFPGGLWSFSFASDTLCPLEDFDEARVAAAGIDFRYYNTGIHRAAFALPEFMRKQVDGVVTPW